MYLDPVFLGVAMLSGVALMLTLMNLRKINALHREMAQAKQDTHLLIHALRNETHAMGTGSIGVGQRLMEVEKRLNQTVERQVELEQKDPGAVTYSYAVRLVEMGATAEDLVQNCGLARGEAELIARVHKEMRAPMQAPEEEPRYSIQDRP